ncbi:YolD-like family protein, partial [Bacillus wiedmannii]
DIDKQSNTVHYKDAFGLNTRLNFEEFVDIK